MKKKSKRRLCGMEFGYSSQIKRDGVPLGSPLPQTGEIDVDSFQERFLRALRKIHGGGNIANRRVWLRVRTN